MPTRHWLGNACCDLSLLAVPVYQLHNVLQAKDKQLLKQAP